MTDATFQTFLVSGLLVLIAAIVYMAWSAWRWVDRERDMEKLALQGVGHEMRLNLQRMIAELASVATGTATGPGDLLPVTHPQLDALLSRPNEADRRALTVLRGGYDELGARKLEIRSTLAQQGDVSSPANAAANAVIDSLAALYLWEMHKGKPPTEAPSTRSWHVRDWMKLHGFKANSLPGMHLRDQVVERLRAYGMELTPKPLTYTASEYYAKLYDRKADPNAPFWKRKAKPEAEPEVEAAVEEAAPVETVADAAPEPAPQPDPAPEVPAEPAPAPQAEQAVGETVESAAESVPESPLKKPEAVH